MDIGNPLEIMFNNQQEVDFLRANLKPTDTVLEWGSGGSTLEIAKRVHRLFSIEHDFNWVQKVRPLLPGNASLSYIPRNQEEKPGDDGTYEDYKDYIKFPMVLLKRPGIPPSDFEKLKWNNKPYNLHYLQPDVIFIDGRARVECARVAARLLAPGGIILIHDYRNPTEKYRRYEYEVVEQFLDCVEGAYALWKFKPKET